MGIRVTERHIITMKLLVVVLALASLALAEPEADPAYLYRGYYGYPHAYRPYGYGYGYYNGFYGRSAYGYGLPNGYTHVDRLHKREADAQVVAPSPYVYNPLAYGLGLPATAFSTPVTATVTNVEAAPIAATLPAVSAYAPFYGFPTAAAAYPGSLVYNTAPVVATAPAAVPHRPFTPYDCVTPDGCAVRALKEAGLAKREAVAEPVAEADADAEAEAYYYGYYGYPGIYNSYYGGYGYGGYAGYYGLGGYGYPYNYYGGYPYNPYVAAAPAAPAVEVKAVEEPVVAAAPLPVAAPYVVPAPVKTVVQKPVTYTHLGAHPIHPTTVLETTAI